MQRRSSILCPYISRTMASKRHRSVQSESDGQNLAALSLPLIINTVLVLILRKAYLPAGRPSRCQTPPGSSGTDPPLGIHPQFANHYDHQFASSHADGFSPMAQSNSLSIPVPPFTIPCMATSDLQRMATYHRYAARRVR